MVRMQGLQQRNKSGKRSGAATCWPAAEVQRLTACRGSVCREEPRSQSRERLQPEPHHHCTHPGDTPHVRGGRGRRGGEEEGLPDRSSDRQRS